MAYTLLCECACSDRFLGLGPGEGMSTCCILYDSGLSSTGQMIKFRVHASMSNSLHRPPTSEKYLIDIFAAQQDRTLISSVL